MSQTDEHALIAEAKRDPEAFGQLYETYVDRIYNYHYRHTSNRADAEDLTSRTFYRALRSLHTYRETGAPFQSWLYRIAHNLVVNWYRDHKAHLLVSIDVEDPLPLRSEDLPPEVWLATTERRQALVAIINSLPEERKTLVILKFVDHLSNAEIAEVMGRTEGAIKSLYHRTLISLRRRMSEGVWDVQESK